MLRIEDIVITHIGIDETVWPVDVESDTEDSAQWVQRYGSGQQIVDQRLSVASVLSAYAALVTPNQSLKDATQKLRLAREAVKRVRLHEDNA